MRMRLNHITPTFHFIYPFFDFVKPWPGDGMYLHFAEVPLSFAPADWILLLNVPLAVDQQAAR